MKDFIVSLILASISMLFSGCHSNYAFNSNINPTAIDDYFKAGRVTLFTEDNIPPSFFNQVAMVDGESCQLTKTAPPASKVEARTNLREAAANVGANGVILNKCVSYKDAEGGCITRVLCLGQAILMEDK